MTNFIRKKADFKRGKIQDRRIVESRRQIVEDERRPEAQPNGAKLKLQDKIEEQICSN